MRRKQGKAVFYVVGRADERSLQQAEFAYAVQRTLRARIQRGWIKTYRPILDDAPHRIFPTMRQYTTWCQETLPSWLGYGTSA
jgi:hypothetical protein